MDDKLRIAILVDQHGDKGVMWAPVRCESHLLTVLEGVLHPETVPQECLESLPKDAKELLKLVFGNLHLNWEDIPDPGPSDMRRN